MAINGNTATGILSQLQDEKHNMYVEASKLKGADFVTITCGGNDLMAVLYEKIASLWNEANPAAKVEPKDVPAKMAEGNLGMLLYSVTVLDPSGENYLINDDSFSAALDDYISTLKEITSIINKINPSCAVVVATQYNPYVEFKGTNFDVVYKGMEDGVSRLNGAIVSNSEEGGYIVSDVKAVFDSYDGEGDLYNADIRSMNVDFHPTAEGHKLLAESFGKTLTEVKYVNYTVFHYYESLDGGFEEVKKEKKAVAGVNVTAETFNMDGFEYKSTAEEITSAKAVEGAELKLYYFRKTYTLTWHMGDDVKKIEHKYGENISDIVAERKGYDFLGWDKTVPEIMPAKDITFIARWEKEGNGLIIAVVFSVILLAVISTCLIHYVENRKKSASVKAEGKKSRKK
jgi:lysophospholipase L1-like esterase